jgi:hypothetical protein
MIHTALQSDKVSKKLHGMIEEYCLLHRRRSKTILENIQFKNVSILLKRIFWNRPLSKHFRSAGFIFNVDGIYH